MSDGTRTAAPEPDIAAKNGHASTRVEDQPGQTASERAEEIVDRVGVQVGRYVTIAGHALLRFAALVREEAEDIVAEAQSLRKSGKL